VFGFVFRSVFSGFIVHTVEFFGFSVFRFVLVAIKIHDQSKSIQNQRHSATPAPVHNRVTFMLATVILHYWVRFKIQEGDFVSTISQTAKAVRLQNVQYGSLYWGE
jgi:uncharacterized protein with PQ loop repeat